MVFYAAVRARPGVTRRQWRGGGRENKPNKIKTGFPKSRSAAFERSSVFDFYSIVCFFDPLLGLSRRGCDMRTIFAESIPLCSGGVTRDGRAVADGDDRRA